MYILGRANGVAEEKIEEHLLMCEQCINAAGVLEQETQLIRSAL